MGRRAISVNGLLRCCQSNVSATVMLARPPYRQAKFGLTEPDAPVHAHPQALVLSGATVSLITAGPGPHPMSPVCLIATVLTSLAVLLLAGCATLAPAVPQVLEARNITVANKTWAGQDALEIALTREEQAAQLGGAGVNRSTYAVIDETLTNGVIEVDVAAIKNGLGGANSRGFAGVAFHLSENAEEFEAVYLRMDNGTLNTPPPQSPRDVRAIQYLAHPGFHFDGSREQAPGQYESGAPVRLGDWHRLRIEVDGADLVAFVDGAEVLRIGDLKRAGYSGRIAMWIGDGSTAYFRNLVIRSAD